MLKVLIVSIHLIAGFSSKNDVRNSSYSNVQTLLFGNHNIILGTTDTWKYKGQWVNADGSHCDCYTVTTRDETGFAISSRQVCLGVVRSDTHWGTVMFSDRSAN